MTEVGLILVALAWVVRRSLAVSPANRLWLDWIAWILASVAILSALLTVLPVASVIWPAADWSALALMLLPLAGVLAGVAARHRRDDAQPEEDEEKGSLLSQLRASPVSQLDVAVGALVGLALAATLAAENVGISFHEFHVVVWDSAAFYALIRLTRLPLSGHGKHLGLETALVNRRMVDAFLLGTTLMALYAIYQFFFTDQAITAEGVHRALGVYGSPNNLALLLGRAVPILVCLAAFSGRALRQGATDRAVPILVCLAAFSGRALRQGATDPERDKARLPAGDGLYRIVLGLALALTLVALVLTFSRGALLLGIPAALVFIGFMRGRGVLGLMLAALAAIGGGILPLLGTDRLRLLLSTDTGTGFFRLRLWQSAWAMLWDHPWLGVGLDNFLYQYRTCYVLPDAWQEPDLSHPHNLVLDFGTRLGLGGIAVLLWVQVAFWQVALSLYRRLPQGRERALILGLMASMVATLAHGLIDNSFFLVDLAFIFFLTLGVVGSTAEEVSIQPATNSGQPVR
jgi:O-antigen ligase